jgi:GNAT superfamily N-acetyltransferase
METNNVSFRIAEESDLSDVFRLQSMLTKSSLDVMIPMFRRMQLYPNYKIWLANVNRLTIGTFALLIMDNLGHNCAPIGIIENVVVDVKSRRLGYGRAMMLHAAKICREAGCYKLILESNLKLEQAHKF